MLHEVTYEEFYDTIWELDAVITVTGKYPFITKFTLRTGKPLGEIVGGTQDTPSRYYLRKD